MNSDNNDLSHLTLESADDLRRRVERERLTSQRHRENELDSENALLKRIGSVRYLNALPLIRGIEDQIVLAHPSELARMLQKGELDAGLVSITEVLFNDGYDFLDGIAIASLGEVKSVFLAHRKPLEQLTEIHCDPASLTSVNLAKVLLGEKSLTPKFVPLESYEAAPQKEAVVLIGDQALDFRFSGHPHAIWDLGAAWFELTNMPFVYAGWALRRKADTKAIQRILRETKDFGMETLDTVIRSVTHYERDFVKDYFEWHIHYHLGQDERRAIQRFGELLEKHRLGKVHPVRFV